MPKPKRAFCKETYWYIPMCIDTWFIVSIQCSLYWYTQGFWTKCINTFCNVSYTQAIFHGSGIFSSSIIDQILNFNLFLCIKKDQNTCQIMNLDSKINQNIFFKSKLDQKGQYHLITLLLPSCWPMSQSATLVAGRSV